MSHTDGDSEDLSALLVIAGPTGSGKSRLAVEVAEALDGEIVSADAFAVYRGMDIGTDKPSPEVRSRVRHHLIDIADPRERFSAGRFAVAADAAIGDILDRGRTPIVAGGTHFYLRALLLGLFPVPTADPELRESLRAEWRDDPDAVRARLRRVDPRSAERIAEEDSQRILRALEVWELTGSSLTEHWQRHRRTLRYRPLLVAPQRSREDLYGRIETRVETMFASGLEEELRHLLASGVPRDAHALKAIGYRQIAEMFDGRWDRPEAIHQTKQASRRLAKRQLTWLRSLREGELHFVPPSEEGGREVILGLWDHHIGEGGRA